MCGRKDGHSSRSGKFTSQILSVHSSLCINALGLSGMSVKLMDMIVK